MGQHNASRVAVSAHLFYRDVSLEIIEDLRKWSGSISLFVTHSSAIDEAVLDAIASLNCPFYLVPVRNAGRDVGAFMQSLRHPVMQEHPYVLKLHTKQGSLDIGNLWRMVFLRSLVGPGQLERLLAAFDADPALMLAGPETAYISANVSMYSNRETVDSLRESLRDPRTLPDWGFFAGTMFFARRSLLALLAALDLEFLDDSGSTDGLLEHGVERIFGLLPHIAGGKIALVRDRSDMRVETLDGVGAPHRRAISAMVCDLLTPT